MTRSGHSAPLRFMPPKMPHFRFVQICIVFVAASISCSDEVRNTSVEKDEPAKSIFIDNIFYTGYENKELLIQFEASLKDNFSKLSEWVIVDASEFDRHLIGQAAREEQLHRLGIRYVLKTSIFVDHANNMSVGVHLTDAWIGRTKWQGDYTGSDSDTSGIAEEVANDMNIILGPP